VVQLGDGVDNVALGDRVGVKWITSACLTCEQCCLGFDNKCLKRKVSGFKTPGTFQQYIITDPRYATPIPDGLSSEAAAPLLCGGVTVWSALIYAECNLGDWLGISGAGGGLGHLAIAYAKAFGLRVVAIDHSSKAEFCKDQGADHFLGFDQFDETELANKVKELTNGGCHGFLVCNSSSRAYDQSLDLLRYAGTLVCVGIPEVDPHPMPKTAPFQLIMNQWKIKGSCDHVAASPSEQILTFSFHRCSHRQSHHGAGMPTTCPQWTGQTCLEDCFNGSTYRGKSEPYTAVSNAYLEAAD
jgi:propanol-preferring alcohol dehydrogenase